MAKKNRHKFLLVLSIVENLKRKVNTQKNILPERQVKIIKKLIVD